MRRLLFPFMLVLLVSACTTKATKETKEAVYGRTTIADAAADLEYRVGDRIFFALDSYNINPANKLILKKQAKFINDHPDMKFVIEGHTDERGTREYNLALGERRANAVKMYLVNQGVRSDRLTIVSYGKEKPAILGHNEDAWSQNRRAVTVIKK